MEDVKKCTKCGRELPLDRFGRQRRKNSGTGYKSWCKDCSNAASAEWYKNNPEYEKKWRKSNPEKVKAKSARWRKNNPEKARASVARWYENNPEYGKRWRKNNSEKCRAKGVRYQREHTANDPIFKMIKNIRTAMTAAIGGKTKAGHTEELLGCSIEEVRNHLERLFQPGMTWDNWGKYGWHLDHIIPLSYFDFTDPEQQKRAWHYTNLQPLWAKDNIQKSNKIIEQQLVLL